MGWKVRVSVISRIIADRGMAQWCLIVAFLFLGCAVVQGQSLDLHLGVTTRSWWTRASIAGSESSLQASAVNLEVGLVVPWYYNEKWLSGLYLHFEAGLPFSFEFGGDRIDAGAIPLIASGVFGGFSFVRPMRAGYFLIAPCFSFTRIEHFNRPSSTYANIAIGAGVVYGYRIRVGRRSFMHLGGSSIYEFEDDYIGRISGFNVSLNAAWVVSLLG